MKTAIKHKQGPPAKGDRVVTQADIAAVLGISVVRVGQLERRALGKIRKSIEYRARRQKMTVHEWLFGDHEA